MNIAIFTNNYKPFIGGVPISIERLRDSLVAKGHTVYIFAPSYPEEVYEKNVIRIPLIKYLRTPNYDFPIANIFSRRTERIFKKLNIDIIHIQHPFWIGKLALSIGKKYNIPCIFTYHTRYEMYLHNLPFSEFMTKNFVDGHVRNFLARCDEVIAPSGSIKEYLKTIKEDVKISVIPTGVKKNFIAMDAEKVEGVREKYGNVFLMSSVCRLTEEKNIYGLIENIRKVKDGCEEKFKCLIIGDGPEHKNLEFFIKYYKLEEDVILLGRVSQEELKTYYMASDIFVFNSLSETQGLVLNEAMINFTPVVALDGTGVRDVVKDGSNGFLCKTNEEFIEKTIYLLKNKTLAKHMGERAHYDAMNDIEENIAERVLKIYSVNIRKGRDYEKNLHHFKNTGKTL